MSNLTFTSKTAEQYGKVLDTSGIVMAPVNEFDFVAPTPVTSAPSTLEPK